MLHFFRSTLGTFIYCIIGLWSSLALWFDSPYPKIFTPIFILVLCFFFFRSKTWLSRLISLAVLFAGILTWWLQLEPSNLRDWQPDVARLPSIEMNGDQLTFRNVRNFEYRSETDFTPRWEDRTYDLSDLRGADLYFSDWGAAGIAHTIVSWDFGPGQHLAISIETRKKAGDTYSAVRGFFRQYELYYVVADERDVIGLRAKYRGEKLKLHRLRIPPAITKAILHSYIQNINRLVAKPKWYNAFTANCTTSIRLNAQEAGAAKPLNWRHFVNKYFAELLYSREVLNTSLPFEVLEARSDITEAARDSSGDPRFSEIIRRNLPER